MSTTTGEGPARPETTPTDRPAPARGAAVAYGALTVFLGAFAAFEMVKHTMPTIAFAVVGAGIPLALHAVTPRDLTGRGGTLRRICTGMLPPVVVLTLAATLTETTDEAAPWWTLGLTWLGHLTAVRTVTALRGGRR